MFSVQIGSGSDRGNRKWRALMARLTKTKELYTHKVEELQNNDRLVSLKGKLTLWRPWASFMITNNSVQAIVLVTADLTFATLMNRNLQNGSRYIDKVEGGTIFNLDSSSVT
ncbi:hypothetical protein BGAL_0025g00100 [Botrytis galanthina]|uniref:Uncharacterized protein n=1 Tax=Botrytis galanthina TaxID=278940 RepID=A0A4S8R9Y2_9HELO|nr:hypothetical protein BGAL_0025g00100 [Botrytis galanthina]